MSDEFPPSDDLQKLVEQFRAFMEHAAEQPITGRDAAIFKRSAGEIFEEKMRTKGLQSEYQIKEIARDVSKEMFLELFAPIKERLDKIEERMATFWPGQEIKQGFLDALNEVGLKATGEDKFKTRTRMERIFAQQDRWADFKKALWEEGWKEAFGKAWNLIFIIIVAAIGLVLGIKIKGAN